MQAADVVHGVAERAALSVHPHLPLTFFPSWTQCAAGVGPSQIGIITPYEGQRAHVVTTMTRRCVGCAA